MVKKLKILVVTLLLSLTSFSQTDTSKICLPYHVAKLIAIDLVQGDSVRAELKQTQKLIIVYQDKVNARDSIISTFEKKEIEYKAEINIYNEKEKIHIEKENELIKDNEKLTKKNNRLKTTSQILGGGFIGTLAVLISMLTLK